MARGCKLHVAGTTKPCKRRLSTSSAARAARSAFGKAARACHRQVGKPKGSPKAWRQRIGSCVRQKMRAA